MNRVFSDPDIKKNPMILYMKRIQFVFLPDLPWRYLGSKKKICLFYQLSDDEFTYKKEHLMK